MVRMGEASPHEGGEKRGGEDDFLVVGGTTSSALERGGEEDASKGTAGEALDEKRDAHIDDDEREGKEGG